MNIQHNPPNRGKAAPRWWYLPAVTILAVATILIIRGNAGRNAYTTHTGGVFGTVFKITFQGSPSLIDTCMVAMHEVDAALSMFNPQSNLSRINRGETTVLLPMTREVLQLAMSVSRATDGCFDITVAPLVNAWGFGYKNGILPDSAAVDSILRHIGYEHLLITDKGVVKRDSLMQLDCSAIAKGYGCDAVAAALRRNGVKNLMVEIGGEVVTAGVNPEGRPWRVGVTRPDEEEARQDVMEVMELNNSAMATSGNYRNFRVDENGRKISHTIDPHTGYPVRHSLLSATVFAPTCAEADAFATAFMVMGAHRAKEILARTPHLSALLIEEDAKGYKVVRINDK